MNLDLSSLNNEQREAVQTIDGPVLIIAGAGTGKTHTLTTRVSYMLQQGIAGENILLVTFTNKAANEMKERIKKQTDTEGDKITACTFHSFCCKFLRKYISLAQKTSIWEALFGEGGESVAASLLGNNFRILSSAEQKDIMDLMRDEYIAIQNERREKKGLEKLASKNIIKSNKLLELWSGYANEECVRLKQLSTYIRQTISDTDLAEETIDILRAYVCYKAERNMTDYDDLLMFAWAILASCESVRTASDAKYKYVMCDEYQDTNTIQDAILDLLSKDNQNLCVCGDDNQSIYRFRGARIENILSFERRYPSCRVIKLVRNYRSTQEILDVSNAMMHHANEGIQKDLIGQSRGCKPSVKCTFNDSDAAEQIVQEIQVHHKDGGCYKDFGVLMRQSRQSAALEALFNAKKIPYKKFGGTKFFDLAVVRDLLAYFQVLANPKDELAYLRIAKQFPGLGSKRGSEFAGMAIRMSREEIKKKYKSNKLVFHRSVNEIIDLLDTLQGMLYQDMMPFLFEDYEKRQRQIILEGSSRMKEDRLEELKDGIEGALPLIDMAKNYSNYSSFIEELVLDQTVNEEVEEDYVSISTVHSAKGLEYENVYLLDASDDFYSRNDPDSEEDREDLRVLYVALTRAKRKLTIFINRQAAFYSEREQSLSHHLLHDDVLDCADADEHIPGTQKRAFVPLRFV